VALVSPNQSRVDALASDRESDGVRAVELSIYGPVAAVHQVVQLVVPGAITADEGTDPAPSPSD
jgi:hypothetical protein